MDSKYLQKGLPEGGSLSEWVDHYIGDDPDQHRTNVCYPILLAWAKDQLTGYPNQLASKAEVIMDKAWEEGHSGGFGDVEVEFWDLIDFLEKFIKEDTDD